MSLPPIVGVAELAQLWRVSRQRVDMIVSAADFPTGQHIRAGRVWAYADVAAWSHEHGRELHPINPPDRTTDRTL